MRLIFAILLLQPYILLSQVMSVANPLEEFPDSWQGDTLLFVVDGPTSIVQLKAPAESGEAVVFTPVNIFEDACWLIHFRMAFNPSSSNLMKIFLAVDRAPEYENGLFLVLGTSADNISLWQNFRGVPRVLIEGVSGRLNRSVVEGDVRVTRQTGGHLLLESNMGEGWQIEGVAHSPDGFRASFFGLGCFYTATRSDKFFFGPVSISGLPYSDTIRPVIESYQLVNGKLMEVFFSEPMDPASLIASGVVCFPPGPVIARIQEDRFSGRVSLEFDSSLPAIDKGTLEIKNWKDLAGNMMADTSISFSYLPPGISGVLVLDYKTVCIQFNKPVALDGLEEDLFRIDGVDARVVEITQESDNGFSLHLDTALPDAVEVSLIVEELYLPNGDLIPGGDYLLYYHEAARHDLVISEIMHDPVPAALLPEVEYLELFNRSELPVDLLGMELGVDQRSAALPHFMLFPGEHVVLYPVSAQQVVSFLNGVAVEGWPGLPNGGAGVVLRNPSGRVVTSFVYQGTLPGQTFKQAGGWSAEIRDPDNLSYDAGNWDYSSSLRGGTPGEVNSVSCANPDVLPPQITDAWLEDDSTMVLFFSEPLSEQDEWKELLEISENSVPTERIGQDMDYLRGVTIFFENPLPENRVFSLNISDQLTDLAGNSFEGPFAFDFGNPGLVDSFDLVINELLFDPALGGCDYVELYNRSEHIADLSALCISRASTEGSPENLVPLGDRCRWFLPGWYLCFTGDPEWVDQYYGCEMPWHLRRLRGLPNFPADGGVVFLSLKNGQIVDYFSYSPGDHFALLANTKGVALERTMADGITNDPMTWHSAAGNMNYGTPGGVNSQHLSEDIPKSGALFTVTPGVFTPDQDGYNDILAVGYSFKEPGYTGSVVIFDSFGHEIRRLVNNRSLGTMGQITWDGLDEQGQKCPPGIYIVWGRVFHPRGQVRTYKTTCVLGVTGRL